MSTDLTTVVRELTALAEANPQKPNELRQLPREAYRPVVHRGRDYTVCLSQIVMSREQVFLLSVYDTVLPMPPDEERAKEIARAFFFPGEFMELPEDLNIGKIARKYMAVRKEAACA